ncbi:ferrous iron transport protein B [Aestuariimicrobium sp. p3-SID1156]|uniref:ferrous iron transport protein B n=1 Tax=Aestuariimicrobium sp. p3-SID1156 TaxID=2916038 RepID=UPI00223BCA43|nr:ferrous iron transport protein B [Aestuariimicrobium sp. p3-SID1156]MCT1459969.1 ferrous iron transport protein B [Aestuariimicrobium sp. p3-SID1156]
MTPAHGSGGTVTATSVPSCHEDNTAAIAPSGAPVVALAGAPNVGKSTLFNTLTGARRTMGNWPGTTVEVGRGAWKGSQTYDLVDLPGAYSLDPASPDEELTRALLVDKPVEERPDLVIVTADAAHLARSLYLVSQVREFDYRVVVALTMGDVAERRGITVDTAALSGALGCPVVRVDPRRRTGLDELDATVARELALPPTSGRPLPEGLDEFDLADDRFSWIDAAISGAVDRKAATRRNWSDKLDRIALSRVWGPIVFLVTMWAVFQVTTTVAAPLQDGLDTFVAGPLSDAAAKGLQAIGLDNPIVHGLLIDGLIAGVGMLLTFVPLMALMFLLLALLEDSGYMARAAVVADRLMRAIGLPGKAFLPLIVGFGCNVPAIAATRVMPTLRQRILTALLVPFTSCSARLTVYVMMGSIFFPGHAGTVVFAMYLVSIALIVLTGLLLKHTLWRTMGSEALIMDLPPYQRPTLRLISMATWTRLKGFLQTATGIIVATVIAVWALQATPVTGGHSFGEVPPDDSAYAAVARTVSPIFAPAGFDTWQTTGALVTGFVAKEAVISSWAQTYAVEDPGATGDQTELGAAITSAFDDSSGGHTLPAVWAFMVFLLAYTPCVATLAAQKREIGLKWTIFGVALQLATAWVLAVAVFQVGRLFW